MLLICSVTVFRLGIALISLITAIAEAAPALVEGVAEILKSLIKRNIELFCAVGKDCEKWDKISFPTLLNHKIIFIFPQGLFKYISLRFKIAIFYLVNDEFSAGNGLL